MKWSFLIIMAPTIIQKSLFKVCRVVAAQQTLITPSRDTWHVMTVQWPARPLLPVLPVLGLYGWCYELVTRICPINHPTSAIRTSVAKWNDVFCPLRLCSYFILHTLNEDKYIFYPLCDSSSDEVWWQIVWWAIVVLTLISFPSYLDLICILRLFNSKMSPQ